jgi:hypothetical protein
MHHHPEPESHPPPLPVQHPNDESVAVTEARVGPPLILDGAHGRPPAWTTLRAGRFTDAPEDMPSAQEHRAPSCVRRQRNRNKASFPARLVPQLVTYAGVMTLLVLIWLFVGVNGGGWYPWPVWPALGWGVGLAIKLAAAKGVRCATP